MRFESSINSINKNTFFSNFFYQMQKLFVVAIPSWCVSDLSGVWEKTNKIDLDTRASHTILKI